MGMVKGAFNQIQQVCMLVCDMASRSVHAPGSFAGRSHISLLQLKDAVTRHETSVDQIKGPDTSSIADASAGDETLIDKLAETPDSSTAFCNHLPSLQFCIENAG